LFIIVLIDGIIILSSILIGTFVFIKNPRNSINKIFYFLMITVAIWSFIEFQSLLSSNINSFLFWDNFDFVWMLTIMVLFHFSLAFTNSSFLLKNRYPLLFIYGIAIFSMLIHYFFVIETNAVLIHGIWYSDYSGISELLNDLFLLIFSFFAFIGMILCIRFYFKNNDELIREKSLFIIVGLAIPVIGGIATDALLTIFFSLEIPVSTIHFIIGTIIFFSYAIWQYDVFSIDIDTAAENIVSTMSDALFLIDKDRTIIKVNNTTEKLTEYKEKELVGQSINILLFNTDDQINILINNSKDVDLSLKTKYGTIIPVSTSCSVIKDKNENLKGYVIICRDITERKKSEEDLIKLASIVKHSSELVNLATLDGRMVFLNEAGCKMLGIDYDNVEQFNIMQVIPNHLVDLVQNDLLPTISEGGMREDDLQYRNLKNGQIVDVHAITFAINDPQTMKPLYLANVSLDITKQKQSENELKQAKKLLEIMNTKLEKKVEERTQEVSKLLKQKDMFINQLGHDLKNPLGPLLNILPILEKKNKDPQLNESFEVLNRNVRHMKNLVTKTIQLSQLNSPSTQLQYEELNLVDEIHEVLEKNKFLFSDNNIEVDNNINESITIQADKLQITELFDNILDNAVKYGPNGRKITIDAEQINDDIIISVKDMGIGMNEEQLHHIFDEFYKADSSRHDFDSSGLGTTICKRIVEMHRGRIWVESPGLGKGSTFYFKIPLHQKDNL